MAVFSAATASSNPFAAVIRSSRACASRTSRLSTSVLIADPALSRSAATRRLSSRLRVLSSWTLTYARA